MAIRERPFSQIVATIDNRELEAVRIANGKTVCGLPLDSPWRRKPAAFFLHPYMRTKEEHESRGLTGPF
jgi:hypothetical protein